MKPTFEEMDGFIEHCFTVLRWPEVQAVAGKWSSQDEECCKTIKRLILAVGEWLKKAKEIDAMDDPEYREYEADEFVRDFIKDFGEEGKE